MTTPVPTSRPLPPPTPHRRLFVGGPLHGLVKLVWRNEYRHPVMLGELEDATHHTSSLTLGPHHLYRLKTLSNGAGIISVMLSVTLPSEPDLMRDPVARAILDGSIWGALTKAAGIPESFTHNEAGPLS